jgi:hypothetical protein
MDAADIPTGEHGRRRITKVVSRKLPRARRGQERAELPEAAEAAA